MTPDEFLVLATRLSASTGEAELRSAVSRAYYDVFHAARLLIEDCGVACPESAEAHDKVSKCLQNSQHANIVATGDKLSSLRTARNRADYRLQDTRYGNPNYVAVQMAIAREIADALRIAQTDVQAIRDPIRHYAASTLKLILRG